MILERARELTSQQLAFDGRHDRNAVRLTLSGEQREHGQAAVGGLIDETDLTAAFAVQRGTDFSKVNN